jgi:ribonuclease T2
MKTSNGLAILVLFAALPAAALNWNQGDPAAQWKSALSAAPAAPAAIMSRPPSGGGGTAGQFDSYVFSVEWTAAFCEGKPGLPECADRSPDRFSAKHLALHGLWPDRNDDASHAYGYCGVDASTQRLDSAATWCRMPAPGISDAVMSRLKPLMPGTASCLENHEWYKHGSCSGFAADQYFTQASALVSFIAESNFGRYLAAHAGQTVSADAVLAAFESDFGAGSRSLVSLTCTKARGSDMLLDVRMKLANPLRPAADLGKMLLPGGGKGNCPASFLLDELPAR